MERQTITGSLSTSGRLSGALSVGGGTTDYNVLVNKPKINNVELVGNKNYIDLGLEPAINYPDDQTKYYNGRGQWTTPPSGVTSYNDLTDKPSINGVTLSGNKTPDDFGLSSKGQFNSLSGVIVSFNDGQDLPLAKCIAEIVPKQAGSGTPSPDNVRAISGSTSVTVTVSDGETSTTKTTPLGQTVYGGQLNVLTGELTIDKGMVTFDGSEQWQSMANVGYPIAYRLDGNWGAKNVSVGTANGFSNRYEYSLISLPEQGYRFANNNADTLYVYDKNFNNDLAGFKSSLSSINMQMCFELATPQTVQLTPQEVNSLLGQNNISADTGAIGITYINNVNDPIIKYILNNM